MNTLDKKEVDRNDYWLIPDNPITKIGVFPYLGRQISPELEPDTVYQVLRPEEELTKESTLKSFELLPIVDEHTMLGTKDDYHVPAEKKGIHGITGTNVKCGGDLITVDIKIFSETLKNEIENGKKDLSLGYYSRYELSGGEYNGRHYDAIQRDIAANHLALVDEGRMGKEVRIMDSGITFDGLTINKEYKKMENEETKQIQEETPEEEKAQKPVRDEEPEEEKQKEENEEKAEDEEEKEEKEKSAEDEEEGEEEKEKKAPGEKAVSMDEAVKYIAKRDNLISKLKPVIGDNTKYNEMSIKEVVSYACDKLDIKPSLDSLEGYLKGVSKEREKVMIAKDSNNIFKSFEQSKTIKEYLK